MRVERLHERRRKAARRSETGPRGNVSKRRDLDLRRLETDHPQHLADDRMLDLVDRVDVFELRVLEKDARRERPHRRDVDVLVDRRRDQKAAVLPVIRGKVRAAAAERDTQGTARDDHRRAKSYPERS